MVIYTSYNRLSEGCISMKNREQRFEELALDVNLWPMDLSKDPHLYIL